MEGEDTMLEKYASRNRAGSLRKKMRGHRGRGQNGEIFLAVSTIVTIASYLRDQGCAHQDQNGPQKYVAEKGKVTHVF